MKISIITINYNNALGLERTFLSVLSQTYNEIEYIVIDGGSTDGSDVLIKKNSHRIAYWVSEPDNGVYNAMNKGIRAATGEYLLFINSGDFLVDKHVIDKLIENESGHYDIIYGNLERIFPDGKEDIVKMPNFISVDLMLNGTLCHPVTLIKKTLFEQYGLYDEGLRIVADWAFFLKVLILGNAKYSYKDLSVSVFSMDGMSSKTENDIIIQKEREWVIDNYFSSAFKFLLKEKQILLNEKKALQRKFNKYRYLDKILNSAKDTIKPLYRLIMGY